MKRTNVLAAAAVFMALTAPVAAQNYTPNLIASSTTYDCLHSGCELQCKSNGTWQVIDKGIQTVHAVIFASGITEYKLDKGYNGKRTLTFGQNELACTISGYR